MHHISIDPDQLNYHHLRYFWIVAREGSISRACIRLHVSQPTISGQLRAFEESIGTPLFTKRGRLLHLTALGETIASYADSIFAAGRELADHLNSGSGSSLRISVGISDQVPKLIAYNIIKPAIELGIDIRLSCREDEPRRLFAELAVHTLDVVLSDQPLPPGIDVKAYNHLLGDTGISFFAAKKLNPSSLKRKFPSSLNDVPLLLPHSGTPLRDQLDGWMAEQNISPRIAGEFQDSALLKVFGQAAIGVFPAVSAIAKEIEQQSDVIEIGRTDSVKERFYAISVERRLTNPAVIAITKQAKQMFAR